jgi:hypothetical protein
MTFLQMQDRTYAVIRDSGKTFVLLTEVKNWLNDACLDIAARLRLLKGRTPGTANADGTVDLPATFMELIRLEISYDAGSDLVEMVDDAVFDSWQESDGDPSNRLGRIKSTTAIETYPAATSLAYTLDYWKKPTALSADGDVSELPEELHLKAVYYAQAEALSKANERGESDRKMAMYEDGLPALQPRGRALPGPISIKPAPGPFDISDGVGPFHL